MSINTGSSAFGTAYETVRQYPSSGARDAHGGVPAVPTLALSVLQERYGQEQFPNPLRTETREVLAGLYGMVTEEDFSIPETLEKFSTKQGLREETEAEVLNRYNSADEAGFQLSGSLNYSAAAIVAAGLATYGINPIKSTQTRLSGETVALSDRKED